MLTSMKRTSSYLFVSSHIPSICIFFCHSNNTAFPQLLQTFLCDLTYTSEVPPHNVMMTPKPVSPAQISPGQSCISCLLLDISTYARTYVQNQTHDPDSTKLVFFKSFDGTKVVTQARNSKCYFSINHQGIFYYLLNILKSIPSFYLQYQCINLFA